MFHLLFVCRFGCYRIKISDDVLALCFVEVRDAPGLSLSDLNQQGIPTAQHVFDDACGPDAFGWIILVEHQLRITGADIENAYLSHVVP
jgi:hypothetical protein